jgi:hypothetical protein
MLGLFGMEDATDHFFRRRSAAQGNDAYVNERRGINGQRFGERGPILLDRCR